MPNGGPQCPQDAVWAHRRRGSHAALNRRGHGTQEANAKDSGQIDNEIITYETIQQLLLQGDVPVKGGGQINRKQTHFTTETQVLKALGEAEANSVKRGLVRQAALPPRCRMLSVCPSVAVCLLHVCRMHACPSVGCMRACRCLSHVSVCRCPSIACMHACRMSLSVAVCLLLACMHACRCLSDVSVCRCLSIACMHACLSLSVYCLHVCRMHACPSVGCVLSVCRMHACCLSLSVCLFVAWRGEAGSMLHAAGCAA